MRNLRIDLCYDGTRYKGWQRLANSDQTIQGKLENALTRILEEPIEVVGSGRTDTGTHALHQVSNFHCSSQMSCEEILEKLRMYLPEDIGIYSVKNVSPRFHARLNAKTKTYQYRVWNSRQPYVFERKYVNVDPRYVDVQLMRQAAEALIGEHDFSAFCANKNMKKSTVRYIQSLTIEEAGCEIIFKVTGNGFLHHMVRIIVGTLLEVGRGERSPDAVAKLFGGRREDAGPMVSASGLCLMEVNY